MYEGVVCQKVIKDVCAGEGNMAPKSNEIGETV